MQRRGTQQGMQLYSCLQFLGGGDVAAGGPGPMFCMF